jgi:amidase
MPVKSLCLFFVLLLTWLTASTQQPAVINKEAEIPFLYNKEHKNPRMHFKVLNSAIRDNKEITKPFEKELKEFGEVRYLALKPYIMDQDIPTIQKHIRNKKLTYKDLVTFYIYRIDMIENDPDLSLNAIISLNPDVIREAELKDRLRKKQKKADFIYGMPILLKDNIGFDGLPTTAGAVALMNNHTQDAFIVKKLKEKGAIILGKTNLSEWAYYFCSGCPLGYSAVGGQSLNPYGRMRFETGGSSSGSGTAVAANYAVAAVGSETSGSILSPSSLNSVTGFKPTVGLLSRTGIVPISSTLDTPGPMTKNVTDNAILMDAMTGTDPEDTQSNPHSGHISYYKTLETSTLKGKRFGVFKNLMDIPDYVNFINILLSQGAEIIELDSQNGPLQGFLTLLNMDMKSDLPAYLSNDASSEIVFRNIEDIIRFNGDDLPVRAPYGQSLFEGIVKDTTSATSFKKIKTDLENTGKTFFNHLFNTNALNAVLSINNMHAAVAAVAKYPCLTIPMGYKDDGEPHGITLIGPSGSESTLYHLAFNMEAKSKCRKTPEKYK